MIIRKIDELGRVVIPAEFREELNISPKCDMEMQMKDRAILLIPRDRACSICGEAISKKKKYGICDNCIAQIRAEADEC